MKIDIVTPPSQENSFTGGLWCIYQYAEGLASRGHSVSVVPMLPSPRPRWFPEPWHFRFQSRNLKASLKRAVRDSSRSAGVHPWKKNLKRIVEFGFDAGMPYIAPGLPFEYYRAASLRYVQSMLRRDADVTIATHFETALPVSMWGGGNKTYFGQHFEPLFWQGSRGAEVSRMEALASYRLGLNVIANSTWLKGQIEELVPDIEVPVCMNAINHEHFYPEQTRRSSQPLQVSVISYGGRNVRWKGFEEMAEAVRICRDRLPNWNIEWNVYGGASLPPRNSVASYNDLGFLDPAALGRAYRAADLLLSASWYESFPLFPLEAMACGLPVVTTAPGTEDFAAHEVTAEVVEPKNASSVASGLCRLITDPTYRTRLRAGGLEAASAMTWVRSVDRMELLLKQGVD